MKKLILVVIGCAAVLAYGTGAFAFHSSGTLVCSSCHTMHYSQDGGLPPDVEAPGDHDYLLKYADSTDLCLTCHNAAASSDFGAAVGGESPQNVVDPNNDFPGGSFTEIAGGDANRHDPSGTVWGGNDGTLGTTPPGGGGALVSFTCSSCHDPHGNANFRILKADPGPTAAAAPVALETTIDVSTPDWPGESATKHNAYNSGMSEWCASCHGNFHGVANQGAGPYRRHPTGDNAIFPTAYVTRYGSAAFDPVVPFEDTAGGNIADATVGASATSRVFCLSCHRAHGSAFADAGRWDFSVASPGGAECNKCHGK